MKNKFDVIRLLLTLALTVTYMLVTPSFSFKNMLLFLILPYFVGLISGWLVEKSDQAIEEERYSR